MWFVILRTEVIFLSPPPPPPPYKNVISLQHAIDSLWKT